LRQKRSGGSQNRVTPECEPSFCVKQLQLCTAMGTTSSRGEVWAKGNKYLVQESKLDFLRHSVL